MTTPMRTSPRLVMREVEEGGGDEGGEGLGEGHVGLVVPGGFVEEIDGAERAPVPYHGDIEHRGAAEGQDQLVVEEHGANVLRGPADIGLPLDEEPLRPGGCR